MIEQDYHNQNILLTGAASGIGFCQMKTYLDAGANVTAIDRQTIDYDHPHLTKVQADLGQRADLDQLVAKLAAADTPVFDIFLSTAGVLDSFQPLLDQSVETIENVLAVDLWPAVALTKAVLPQMVEQGRGQLVYMASIAGLQAGGGGAAYTMAKHALVGLTKQMTFDYASQGIRANAIAPGAIQTPMNAADFAGDGMMAKQVAEQTPAKRWADPQEVADLSLYLTSPQASYMNGAVLTLDGGWSLGH
ncbi:3-ketoacyl-ACP reductase [Fructobacillus pseudoficulneus]|uniref:3-ketoacyl-ACP reductase n=1 Tax=Fructobacillus pseudoficulneus TaxID=220714 RepID=A0A3F3H269_9LACO|nr:3-oxoacyl-ACP reductase [Fructobacillus pseudoficulneus]GAP02668.1 3-ketoacyl-ACP reductase [Fructobacillus pseudoficulneus]SEH38943.1 3-oxoacyl-[acyl-carrier protein] reductase [Fructobacillus pseudoficulneus]